MNSYMNMSACVSTLDACIMQAGTEAQRGGHPGLQMARGRGAPRR
jgi:hypothetical protein